MTFRTVAEVVLGLGFVIVAGMLLTADKAYKCDDTGLAMNCDSLSKYYSLPNGKCLNAEYGNKLCRSGWEPLADLIEEEELPTIIIKAEPIKFTGDYTTSPDGKICYLQGDLRRGVSCEN